MNYRKHKEVYNKLIRRNKQKIINNLIININ